MSRKPYGKAIYVEVTEELKKKIDIHCITCDLTLRDFVLGSIKKELQSKAQHKED